MRDPVRPHGLGPSAEDCGNRRPDGAGRAAERRTVDGGEAGRYLPVVEDARLRVCEESPPLQVRAPIYLRLLCRRRYKRSQRPWEAFCIPQNRDFCGRGYFTDPYDRGSVTAEDTEPRTLVSGGFGLLTRAAGLWMPGMAAGLAGAWGITRWLRSLLFEVPPVRSARFPRCIPSFPRRCGSCLSGSAISRSTFCFWKTSSSTVRRTNGAVCYSSRSCDLVAIRGQFLKDARPDRMRVLQPVALWLPTSSRVGPEPPSADRPR
jgi:hypothetical protein